MYGQIDASIIGLAISQALSLIGQTQYGSQQTTNAINNMTSAERVLQYTKIEQEETSVKKKQKDDKNVMKNTEG